jgi:predicted nucleic acid-binding Zn ribbon protein
MSILSCPVCVAPLPAGRKLYCSDFCKRRAKYEREKASGYEEIKRRRRHKTWDEHLALTAKPNCTVDGCTRKHTAKGFCLMHWKADKRRNGAEWAVSGSDFKRRALQYGVKYERFDKRGVFARDNWTCQICGLPVEREEKFPAPFSPSIDHIIPISRGGDHIPENTQCTHLSCNMRKSNNLEVVNVG